MEAPLQKRCGSKHWTTAACPKGICDGRSVDAEVVEAKRALPKPVSQVAQLATMDRVQPVAPSSATVVITASTPEELASLLDVPVEAIRNPSKATAALEARRVARRIRNAKHQREFRKRTAAKDGGK